MTTRRPRPRCQRCLNGCGECWSGCLNVCSCLCVCCYEYGIAETSPERVPLLGNEMGEISDVNRQSAAQAAQAAQAAAALSARPSGSGTPATAPSVVMQAPTPPQMVYQMPPPAPAPVPYPYQHPYLQQFMAPPPPAQYFQPQYIMPPQQSGAPMAAPQYAAPHYSFTYMQPPAPQQQEQQKEQPQREQPTAIPIIVQTAPANPFAQPPASPATSAPPPAPSQTPAPSPPSTSTAMPASVPSIPAQVTVTPVINVTTPASPPLTAEAGTVAPSKKKEAGSDTEGEGPDKAEKPWKRLLDRATPEIKSLYEFGSVLGRGSTSIVRQVKERKTGGDFACKSMAKAKMTKRQHVEDMKREIQVMHHLAGHPNVVKLHGVYEDRHNIHLVMDLCTGGELFDHILASGGYTEANAAAVMRTIIAVVEHCHTMGVIHRDIKPENFLWEDATFTRLKAIDFGLSAFFKPGKFFKDLVGSKYYVAPEVLRRSYTHQADIWSCGVVLYMMLTGIPPFLGDTLHDVFDNILKGDIDYETSPWPELTTEALNCTKSMLTYQSKKRITAAKLLQDPWMKEDGAAPDKPVNSTVIQRFQGFSGMNRLQQIARKIIVRHLPMEEIEGLKHLFETLDADHNGTITAEELRTAVSEKDLSIPVNEFEQILKAADVDGNGTVDYNEFLAATLNAANLAKEENLLRAFEHFDADNSGYITRNELIEALTGYGEVDNLEAILEDVDKDQDGNIDYEEFREMMLRNIGDF